MNKAARDVTERELKRLLDEAMKQPGVADVMAAFEVWRKAEEISTVQRMYDGRHYVVSVSDVSTPLCER